MNFEYTHLHVKLLITMEYCTNKILSLFSHMLKYILFNDRYFKCLELITINSMFSFTMIVMKNISLNIVLRNFIELIQILNIIFVRFY